jgi:hypothetical protein
MELYLLPLRAFMSWYRDNFCHLLLNWFWTKKMHWALSLWVKRPEREADHSSPSSIEVKNAWSYTSTPQYAFS